MNRLRMMSDDSGYISNSLTLETLSLDASSSVDDHLQISSNKRLVNSNDECSTSFFDSKTKTNTARHNLNQDVINENLELTIKNELSYTSTPYSRNDNIYQDIDEKLSKFEAYALCTTPKNRKRKNTWKDDDYSFDTDQLYASGYESVSNRERFLLNCTRKLWTDTSDGSLSDTDLDKTSSKKICVEGSRSEPTSPQRNQLISSPHCKLGTIEKNNVLYPELRYRAKPKKYKISTPSKIRQQVKEEYLFERTPEICLPNQKLTSFIRASQRVDFFTLFTIKSSNFHIIQNILSYLEPSDLAAVYYVCKIARNCISQVPALNSIRKKYLYQKKINKENVCSAFLSSQSIVKVPEHDEHSILNTTLSVLNVSDNLTASIGSLNLNNEPACKLLKTNNNSFMKKNSAENKVSVVAVKTSPRKREWLKFVEASADLTPGQKLTRCSRCSNPAKVITHVVICTRRGCQFICCSKCCDPMCLSVQFFEKCDINNMLKTDELLSLIPACSSPDNNTPTETWNGRKRLFLAECSNSNQKTELLSLASNETSSASSSSFVTNNNNNNDSDALYGSQFSSTFNLNILTNVTNQQSMGTTTTCMKRPLPKTVNDLIECKTNKTLKMSNNGNKNLFFVPESPPKVNRPAPISSKISKKNLRRL